MRYEIHSRIVRVPNLHTEPGLVDVPDDERIVNVQDAYDKLLGFRFIVYSVKEVPDAHTD